jgi:hypothetical protein
MSIPLAALISGAMTAAIFAATWKISPQSARIRAAYTFTSSITAATKASGASCGRLMPRARHDAMTRRPVNFAALARPSLAGRHAIGVAIERHRGTRDRRQRRQSRCRPA